MRRGDVWLKIRTVQSPKPQRFTLEFDSEQEPIAGSLTDERGTRAPFSGWLGLARLLERALRRPGGESDREEGSDGGGGP